MNDFNKISNQTRPIKMAIYSFAGGTFFFISHLLFPNEIVFLIGGWCFVVIALFTNAIMLLFLMRKLIVARATRFKTIEEIAILLSNIPITALYLFIIINQNNLF